MRNGDCGDLDGIILEKMSDLTVFLAEPSLTVLYSEVLLFYQISLIIF